MSAVVRAAIVIVATAAAGSALWHWCFVPVHCNRELTAVAGLLATSETLPLHARETRADDNIERLTLLRRQCGADFRIPYFIGASESLAGRHEQAVTAYREALQYDRRPEIYDALGQSLIALGRMDEAIDAYVQIARFGGVIDERYSNEITRRVEERLGAQ